MVCACVEGVLVCCRGLVWWVLVLEQSSVDKYLGACHVAGVVGEQEEGDGSGFIGGADPTHWGVAYHAVFKFSPSLLGQEVAEVGGDCSWYQRVDAYALWCQFVGPGSCCSDQGGFGGGVDRCGSVAFVHRAGAGQHDRRTGMEMVAQQAELQEGGANVDGHHLVEEVGCGVGQGANSGVASVEPYAVERRRDVRCELSGRVWVGGVVDEYLGRWKFLLECLLSRFVSSGDDDVAAFCQDASCACQADAACAASDQDALALETIVRVRLFAHVWLLLSGLCGLYFYFSTRIRVLWSS